MVVGQNKPFPSYMARIKYFAKTAEKVTDTVVIQLPVPSQLSKHQKEEGNGKNSMYVATKAILGNKVRFLWRTREMDHHHSQWSI